MALNAQFETMGMAIGQTTSISAKLSEEDGFLSGMNGNFAQNSISSFKDTTGKEITFQCHGIFASKSSTCTLCHQFNRKGRQEVRERVERSSADIRREYNY
ncbi:unnamed protein product [Porites evermanni]|uniref:Uncharacterized protein n=1 Tax=Porites evermanni TaxID=104178 RepID=A0ABN8RJP1_9CNID|nr:unnamed protein product [Porites evermanni]